MKKSMVTAALMAMAANGMSGLYAPIHHAGGKCARQFDFGSIHQARKKNQRNKNQKRIKAM